MKQKSKEGFSLVEMLIALAASSIVMLSIMMIMGFCTSTMRRTQQRVDLQEQAKDAMNHISAYTMEADSAVWSDSAKLLTIVKKTVQNVGTAERKVSATDTYFYWEKDGSIYFASKYDLAKEAGQESDVEHFTPSFAADKRHLMAENISSLKCEKKSVTSSSHTNRISVELEMKKDDVSYKCQRDISLRK